MKYIMLRYVHLLFIVYTYRYKLSLYKVDNIYICVCVYIYTLYLYIIQYVNMTMYIHNESYLLIQKWHQRGSNNNSRKLIQYKIKIVIFKS